jgi:hypothetical protein
VESIDDFAFCACISLTEIVIPDSVTRIGWDAFGWCESLTSITIPENVTSIGNYAFGYCSRLTSIDLSNHDVPPTLKGASAIPYSNNNLIIYVKPGTLSKWKSATNWSTMSSKFREK